MATAEQDARERADRLRRVLDECEAILDDKAAEPERREVAARWYARLGGIGRPWENAGASVAWSGSAGGHRHTNGGGQSLNQDARYDGWGQP